MKCVFMNQQHKTVYTIVLNKNKSKRNFEKWTCIRGGRKFMCICTLEHSNQPYISYTLRICINIACVSWFIGVASVFMFGKTSACCTHLPVSPCNTNKFGAYYLIDTQVWEWLLFEWEIFDRYIHIYIYIWSKTTR